MDANDMRMRISIPQMVRLKVYRLRPTKGFLQYFNSTNGAIKSKPFSKEYQPSPDFNSTNGAIKRILFQITFTLQT